MRILTRANVQQAMEMQACIDINADVYAAVAAGRVKMPVRHHIPVEGQGEAVALFMPGYLPDSGALGMKIVSVFPNNPGQGLPATVGVITLISAETGLPIALMDGTWLTSLRTGAGSGVATRLMARSDSRVLGLLGAGGMGFHQIEAVAAVRPIEQVLIWNRTESRAHTLADQVREYYGSSGRAMCVDVVGRPDAAVRNSDVVVVSTSASEPVLLGEWVRPGTHVNLVGAHGAAMREADDDLLAKAQVRAVDGWDSASFAGEIRIPLESGRCTRAQFVQVGEFVAGQRPGRTAPTDITWFKSVGLAAQDLACARVILDQAAELGLGTEIEL